MLPGMIQYAISGKRTSVLQVDAVYNSWTFQHVVGDSISIDSGAAFR